MFTFNKSVLKAPVIMMCGLAMGIGQAMAGPKPDEVARLSEDLTPMGSERAGNAEGTIPAWTGGITEWPEGYSPGDHHPDPFADDEPLFRIDASNYQEYADQLSVGQIAMFERYPESYFMDVYPTRRSASYPERSIEMTIANASTAELVAGCLLYTSPSPRDVEESRMPSSA